MNKYKAICLLIMQSPLMMVGMEQKRHMDAERMKIIRTISFNKRASTSGDYTLESNTVQSSSEKSGSEMSVEQEETTIKRTGSTPILMSTSSNEPKKQLKVILADSQKRMSAQSDDEKRIHVQMICAELGCSPGRESMFEQFTK